MTVAIVPVTVTEGELGATSSVKHWRIENTVRTLTTSERRTPSPLLARNCGLNRHTTQLAKLEIHVISSRVSAFLRVAPITVPDPPK
jgi:hypothetical protein